MEITEPDENEITLIYKKTMKFLDVKTDFAFKKVFGRSGSKDILISFLNAVIEFENNCKI